MKDHEVKALFKTTLEDFQLSRNERGEIRDLLDVIKGNEQKRALFRSMAFDEAREALAKADAGQRFQVVDWLENTVKALHPAENLPGATKGVATSAWFSPDDNCVGKISDLFAQARASVDICVFTITDNRIVEAIEKALVLPMRDPGYRWELYHISSSPQRPSVSAKRDLGIEPGREA